ncbi:MAG: uracil-DNA glycosylase [Parcubacteria group bacterium]|jgi:DNA polymerase
MKSKQEQLVKLNKHMSACSKCALRAGCIRVVPGEGSADAKIMFIGEAPGKKEDETGHPFVGAAGKFLNEMLASIKLQREDVYIANVCKCRPPENRDPLPEEVAACWPWLLEQIKIIQPKLIVTLGRHSMERFLPDQKISQMHGTLVIKTIPKIGQQNFYTLYHPAAALYNGSMRKTLLEDFAKIPKILQKIKK